MNKFSSALFAFATACVALTSCEQKHAQKKAPASLSPLAKEIQEISYWKSQIDFNTDTNNIALFNNADYSAANHTAKNVKDSLYNRLGNTRFVLLKDDDFSTEGAFIDNKGDTVAKVSSTSYYDQTPNEEERNAGIEGVLGGKDEITFLSKKSTQQYQFIHHTRSVMNKNPHLSKDSTNYYIF